MTFAAEFTNGSKRRPPVLTLNVIANGERKFHSVYEVANKREARSIAAKLGATPWNF
jgi:hypothetical protein